MMPFIYGHDQIPLLSSSFSPPGQLGLRGSAHRSGLGLCTLSVWQRYKPSFPSNAAGHALLFSVPWSEDLYVPMPWPYPLQILVTFWLILLPTVCPDLSLMWGVIELHTT